MTRKGKANKPTDSKPRFGKQSDTENELNCSVCYRTWDFTVILKNLVEAVDYVYK